MCCKSLVLHVGSAPASNTKYTSVKRWEEKDRLHMASRGRVGCPPSGGGVLEKACWEELRATWTHGALGAWDRDRNKCVGVGAVHRASREDSMVGGVRRFLGQSAISLEAVQN